MALDNSQQERAEDHEHIITAFIMHGKSQEEARFFIKNALHMRMMYLESLAYQNKLDEVFIAFPQDPTDRKEFIKHLLTPLGATLEYLKREPYIQTSHASLKPLPHRIRTGTYLRTTHAQSLYYRTMQKDMAKRNQVREERESRDFEKEEEEDNDYAKNEWEELQRLFKKCVEYAAAKAHSGKTPLPVQVGSRGKYDFSDIWLIELGSRGGQYGDHVLEIRATSCDPEESEISDSMMAEEMSKENAKFKEMDLPRTGFGVKHVVEGGRRIFRKEPTSNS